MAAPASSSSASSPAILNIRETPAVVEWTAQVVDDHARADPDTDAATSCHLARASNSSPITFSLFFDPSSKAAFFRLRATILVRDPSRDKTQIPVFLFIYPEHVASIAHDEASILAPEIASIAPKKLSGCRTTCLRFALNKPASLIAPLHVPLVPRSRKDAQVLRSLRMLANTTALAVHFAHEALPSSGVISLVCDAAAAKSLKSSVNHSDPSQLYGGQGGKVLEDVEDWPVPCAKDDQETAAAGTSGPSPPSYDEAVPRAGPARAAPSLKRPRTSSGLSEGGRDPLDMMSICKKAVAEQMACMRMELRNEIRSEVKAQLSELENGLTERLNKRLDDQMAELRDELTGQVDKTEERMDEIEGRMDDLIDEGIEDRVLGIKVDMQDFVKDEMANVEDTIIKHFEDGRVSLLFER